MKVRLKPKKIDAIDWAVEHNLRLKKCAVERLLALAVDAEKIAANVDVSIDFVLDIQSKKA